MFPIWVQDCVVISISWPFPEEYSRRTGSAPTQVLNRVWHVYEFLLARITNLTFFKHIECRRKLYLNPIAQLTVLLALGHRVVRYVELCLTPCKSMVPSHQRAWCWLQSCAGMFSVKFLKILVPNHLYRSNVVWNSWRNPEKSHATLSVKETPTAVCCGRSTV